MRQQAERQQKWDDGVMRIEAEMQEDEWEELGHRVTQWHLMEDMDGMEEEEEERECRAEQMVEELRRTVGNGAAQAVTHPRWHDKWGSVIPVSGVNCSEEPMVIRKGNRIAVGTKLTKDQVAMVEDQAGANFVHGNHEEVDRKATEEAADCWEGTTSGDMPKDMEHKELR